MQKFDEWADVMASKEKPKRLKIFGGNGKRYGERFLRCCVLLFSYSLVLPLRCVVEIRVPTFARVVDADITFLSKRKRRVTCGKTCTRQSVTVASDSLAAIICAAAFAPSS